MIDRRQAIGAIGAGLAGTAAVAVHPAATRVSPLDFGRPPDRLKAYMLMRGALDDRIVIGCATALYYGNVDAELTPLFGVVSATFSRYRRDSAGGFFGVSAEHAYFTDMNLGKAIDRLKNPYTGATVDVPSSGYAPLAVTITPDMTLKPARAIPGVIFDHHVSAFEARGDDVWITELIRTSRDAGTTAKASYYSENVVLHARRSDLENPGVPRVRCEVGFTNVVNWRPWLQMDAHPGHLVSAGSGRYGIGVDELPAAWVEATRVHRPDLLADPASVLAPLWNAKS